MLVLRILLLMPARHYRIIPVAGKDVNTEHVWTNSSKLGKYPADCPVVPIKDND